MAVIQRFQTAFTAGVLDPLLRARKDTGLYYLACQRLDNVMVRPQGAAQRRPCMRMVAPFVPGADILLVPFVFNVSEQYLFSFTPGEVRIWNAITHELEDTITTPYTLGQMAELRFIQLADVMIIVHPDHAPQQIVRDPTDWSIEPFEMRSFGEAFTRTATRTSGSPVLQLTTTGFGIGWGVTGDGIPEGAVIVSINSSTNMTISQAATASGATTITLQPLFYSGPFHAFHGIGVTINPSATTGEITVVTSAPYFVAGHVGLRLEIEGIGGTITAVAGATQATLQLSGTLPDANPTARWREQALSELRGWPRTVAFAQQRLIFGGSRSVPQRLWMSVIGDFRNFDEGDGDDDEAISVSTATGSINAIRHLAIGRGGLEVYTDGEEGVVPFGPDSPLAPRRISYTPHTRHGSGNARPAQLDGSTIFVQRAAGTVREFIWNEAEQGYISDSLSVRAPHLLNAPVSMAALSDAFGEQLDLLAIVNGDGTMAVLSTLRAQQVAAWSRWKTAGQVRSVATVADQIYLAVRREALAEVFSIEVLDLSGTLDASTLQETSAPTATWPGLEWLADRDVSVIADGVYIGERRVDSAGVLELEVTASRIEVGHDFAPVILPMPLDTAEGSMIGRPRHPFRAIVRVKDTSGLLFSLVDRAGARRKTYSLPTKRFDGALDQPVPTFTGDHSCRLIGWSRDGNVEITQSGPFPMTILGFALEVAVN